MKFSQQSKYKVIWEDSAKESLKAIDNWLTAEKIITEVEKHLAKDPIWHGEPLKYQWEGFWKYKVSRHRIIYEIVYELTEKELIILVVKVGERKRWQPDDVYKGELPRSTSKKQTITKRPKLWDSRKKKF